MKEIWKKSSLFYKLIAIMLTVVMVGTSVYFHFDRKYSAKAAYGGSITITKKSLTKDVNPYTADSSAWGEITGAADTTANVDYYYCFTLNDAEWDYITVNDSNNIQKQINRHDSDLSVYLKVDPESTTTFNNQITVHTTDGQDSITDVTWDYFTWFTPVFTLSASLSGEAEGKTSFANDDFSFGKNATITVSVSSTKEISELKVLDQTFDNLTTVINGQTDSGGTYNLTYVYSFGNSSKIYSSEELAISVKNVDGEEKILTAASIVYDCNDPIIYDAKVDGDTEQISSSKWYKGTSSKVTVTFKAKSGDVDALTNETDIKTFKITENNTTLETYSGVAGKDLTLSHDFTDSGIHNVTVEVIDNAGNTTTQDYVINVDLENPSVTSIDVSGKNIVGSTNYVKLNAEDNVIISGAVSEAYSGIADSTGLVFHAKKDGAVDYSTNQNYTLETGTSYNYSVSLGNILGGNVDFTDHTYDATYDVWVVPTDVADNVGTESSHIIFVLDSTPPAITTPYGTDIILQVHETASEVTDPNASGYWIDVNADKLDSSGKYLVNKVKYERIRYKVKATDLNFNTLKFTSAGLDTSVTAAGDGWFYHEVSMNDIPKASALEYSVTATDMALNETTVVLPSLQEVNSDITVNLVSIAYNGEPIAATVNSATDWSNIFSTDYNGIYTLTVNVTSGYPIDAVYLNKNGVHYKGYSSTDSEALITNTPDSSGVYVTNDLTFILPKSDSANELMDSMAIFVQDTYTTPRTVEVDLGDLLYDNTQPIIVNNGTLESDKWYQEYTLDYEIKSGVDVINVPESNLLNASYAIDGGSLTNVDVTDAKSKTGTIEVPESTSITGTKIVFDATDKATNTINTASTEYPNQIIVKVDKTAPQVSTINLNGEAVTESTVLAGTPSVTSKVTDNLTINNYVIAVKYNGEDYASSNVIVNKDGSEQNILYNLDQIINGKEIKDGKYTISIVASDKSGRTSNVSSTSFVIDNTAPVVTANITSGKSGKKNGYYNSDVTVRLTCTDNNFNPNAMTVTDNGSEVGVSWKTGNDMYYADLTLSSEGIHDIRVSGKDKAGTAAVAKQVSFVIDKTEPTVSILLNGGQTYSESRGTLNLTGPLTINASVNDSNVDSGDLRVQVIKTVPDTATTTSEYLPTSERTFTFSDEADYVVNIYAVDKANNQGPTRTISFRVDTTAPQLTITGANGGTSAGATSVSFNITEAFWSDAKGTVEIYRKAGDGVDEVLYKTLTVSPTQRAYSLSELLNESGIYRFEFTAEDKVGHTATTSQKITVDRNKPEITLTGVKNYDSTDGAVSIAATIADEFYANKKVNISGTRIDATGKKTALSFSPYAATANPTTINDTFTEEGIYDITISATDIAGNVASNSVHFTIDTSAPIIGDLSKYDGKTFNKIDLDIDLDELVSDLTVCDVRMYLNGSEYDGISDIEDGSYTLLITAEDELGHTSEKSVTFVLDTKEPIFIVTGVEDGEIRNDTYSIEVSLQLDEDTLDSVTLNDESVLIKNNVASINVTDKGEYELYMKAYDEAGNEAEQTITFTFGEESVATVVTNAVEKAASHWWMWAIVVAAIFAVGGFIFFILKRKKDNE